MTEEPHRSRRVAIMKAHPEVSFESPLPLFQLYFVIIGLVGSAEQRTAGFRTFISFHFWMDPVNHSICWPVHGPDLLLRLTPHLGLALSIQLNESILP